MRNLRCFALAAVLILGFGRGAEAQFLFEDDILPPRVIAWRLADRGFSGMTRPRYDGRAYEVVAVDPAGIPVQLSIDPADGAIIGRRRLGGRYVERRQDYARLEHPAPGFGWTEDDIGPRRASRPPSPDDDADFVPRAVRRPGVGISRPDPGLSGLNPDADARPEAPRRISRTTPPVGRSGPKPTLRTTPDAPAPEIAPVEAKSEPRPEAPAAKQGRSSAIAEAPKAAAPEWRDLPTEGRRPVRVIEGATVVPGTVDAKDGTP